MRTRARARETPCLRRRNHMRRLHVRDGLSAHEIGRQLGVSLSTVLETIRTFGVDGSVRRDGVKKLKGQIRLDVPVTCFDAHFRIRH